VTAGDTETSTRDRLLHAAVRLIPELGWGNVSTRLVADAAGVNAGVVHYHFGSVPDLLRQAATAATRGAVQAAVARLTSRTDPVTAVHDLLLDLAGTGSDDATHILLFESALAATRDPQLQAETAVTLTQARQELSRWLTRVSDLPHPDSTATALAALIDGYLLHRTVDPALDPVHLLPALHALLLDCPPVGH